MAIDKISGTISFSFNGRNGTGAISIPGLKAGDQIIRLTQGGTDYTADPTMMEWVISVDDQIHQISGTNLTTYDFVAVAVR
jgi:hypothetical protein